MDRVMTVQRISAQGDEGIRLFPLEGLLLPGQVLSVNTSYLILSLVSTTLGNDNPILLERPVTETNMRLLLRLLESPYYCPQEVLRASLFCSYQVLLTGLFSSDSAAREEWKTMIEEQRLLLQHAQELGTWKKTLKPLYNALSKLRPKLHPFGLEVAVSASYSAYMLMALPFLQQQTDVCRRSRCASNERSW